MPESTEPHGSRPGMSPAEILGRELKQACQEHALWTLTTELRRIYGPEAERISVTASPQADTGKLTADTLRVLDDDFDTLLPGFALVQRACEVDADLRENLAGLADLTDPERFIDTEEDLGDHLIGSPVFLTLKRALDAWLNFAPPPEHPGWPYREELAADDAREVVLPSSMKMRDMTVSEFVTLKRRLLNCEVGRSW